VPGPQVLVVGGGPAGRALAAACAERGMRTTLIDPAPNRPWRACYGGWLDELPAELPATTFTPVSSVRAVTSHEHRLERTYAVFATDALREHLDQRLRDADVRIERARARRETITSQAGNALVIDASGSAQALASPRRRRRVAAEQTAAGVIVPAASAHPLVGPDEALFMDWRPIPSSPGDPPTFLYAIPLSTDRVLLEETSLARRPGLDRDTLRRRLAARLAAHHIYPPPDAPQEWVRFPLDLPRHRAAPGVLAFGAAAALTHPATGYQLAAALRLAGPVADAIANALRAGPVEAARAGEAALWPPAAKITHLLRRRGLESLLGLPAHQLPEFFAGFFSLPAEAQHRYLTVRDDPSGVCSAMAGMFRTTRWPLRFRLIGSSLLVNAYPD
jgi:lycopene beta-cyclase